jgi:hypothetical protein
MSNDQRHVARGWRAQLIPTSAVWCELCKMFVCMLWIGALFLDAPFWTSCGVMCAVWALINLLWRVRKK